MRYLVAGFEGITVWKDISWLWTLFTHQYLKIVLVVALKLQNIFLHLRSFPETFETIKDFKKK
jgi:hypothetical protein